MEVHSGFLTLKISGRLKSKLLSNCWCILYYSKNSIPPRLDIYENRNKSEPYKSLVIIDAKWHKADTLEPAFCFSIKGKRYVFVTQTEEDCTAWRQFLCCLSADLFASHKAVSSEGGIMDNDDSVIMQDNCLYASSNEVALFDVVADQNGCCSRLGFEGLMKLCFELENIKLYQMNGTTPLAEWTYYSVRSFGYSKHTLNITVGKKSSTGQGNFSFMTMEGSAMVELIILYTKRLKEQEKTAHTTTSHLQPLTSAKQDSVHSNASTSKKRKPAPSIPSPKPVSPLTGHSPSSLSLNAFDTQFKKEPNITIGAGFQGDGKQPLEQKNSNNSSGIPSESIGKISVIEKNPKQMEKKDKKQAKEREKMEKERQKHLEKVKKNEGKGNDKRNIPTKAENEYSEAISSHENDLEDVYDECNFDTRDETSTQHNVDSKVYMEPWGAFPIPIIHKNPDNNNDYDETEDIYAAPVKYERNLRATHIVQKEEYEDVGINVPPPTIPSKRDLEWDSNNIDNVYDHFVGDTPSTHDQPENVYGLDSGTPLTNNIKREPSQPSFESDVYSTVD